MVRAAGGFTLVEILVALVVLQVGLLGVLGSLVLAARTLTRAEALERAVVELHQVYDSLSSGAAPGEGERTSLAGRLRWVVGADGTFSASFLGDRDSLSVPLEGHVPIAGSEP